MKDLKYIVTGSMGQLIAGGLATLVGIILPLMQMQTRSDLTVVEQGLVGSVSLMGITAGSLLFGRAADRSGYVRFLLLCPLVILLGSLIAYRSIGLDSLLAGLFVMGLGIGGEYAVDPDYLADTVSPARKELALGAAKTATAVGNVGVAAVCFFIVRRAGTPDVWHRLLLLTSALALVTLLLRFCFLPVSCRKSGEESTPKVRPAGGGSFASLFRKENRRRVWLCGVPWLCQSFAGYGMGVFLPLLVMQLGLDTAAVGGMPHLLRSVELTGWINCFVLLGFVLGLFLVQHVRHLHLQAEGFLFSAAGLLLLGVAHHYRLPVWIALAGFMLFKFFLNVGPNLTTFMLPSELYPAAERGLGNGLASAMGKVGSISSVFAVPFLLRHGGMEWVVGVNLAVLLLGAAVTMALGRK